MKALVGAFNQEKALVIVQPVVEPMDSFTALLPTFYNYAARSLLRAGSSPARVDVVNDEMIRK